MLSTKVGRGTGYIPVVGIAIVVCIGTSVVVLGDIPVFLWFTALAFNHVICLWLAVTTTKPAPSKL